MVYTNLLTIHFKVGTLKCYRNFMVPIKTRRKGLSTLFMTFRFKTIVGRGDFTKEYNFPIEETFDAIGGKWKEILLCIIFAIT